MRNWRRALCLFLVLCMLPLGACSESETLTTEEKEGEAKAEEKQAITEADRAFLKEYLASYEKGEFDADKLFLYEDLSPYVTLPAYRGVSFPQDPMLETEVSDKEVEAYLTQIYLAELPDSEYTALTEGVVAEFDMATIDYRGVIDGVENPNATAEDQSLLIGSGTFIPGFEEALLGKEIGSEVTFTLTFSPYYRDEDVAGKDATFTVKIKNVDRPKMPVFTPEVINKYYKTEFEDMNEVRTYFRAALESMKKNNAHSALGAYLQKKVLAGCVIHRFPEKELEHYRTHFLSYYEAQKGEETSWDDYCAELGITYDKLLSDAKTYAEEEVRILLMVRAIAQKEGITCTSEQMGALIEGIYTSQNTDGYYGNLKSMVTDYTDVYGASYFENMVISAAVAEVLVENSAPDAA